MSSDMLEAFAEYERRDPAVVGPRHNVVGMPLGSRLHRIYRRSYGWQLWIATADFVRGTYLELHDNGQIVRVTIRDDEGDEHFAVRPTDEHIRSTVGINREGDTGHTE